MKELSSVLPLIYAKGTISIILVSNNLNNFFSSYKIFNASYNGAKYGSTLSLRSPGKNPKFSPASTAGRHKTILSIRLCSNAETAKHTARKVFPVPAGPLQKTTSLLFTVLQYLIWPSVLG